MKAKLADVTACLEEFLTHNYKGQSDGLERVEKCGGELPEAIKKAAKGGVKHKFATQRRQYVRRVCAVLTEYLRGLDEGRREEIASAGDWRAEAVDTVG